MRFGPVARLISEVGGSLAFTVCHRRALTF